MKDFEEKSNGIPLETLEKIKRNLRDPIESFEEVEGTSSICEGVPWISLQCHRDSSGVPSIPLQVLLDSRADPLDFS